MVEKKRDRKEYFNQYRLKNLTKFSEKAKEYRLKNTDKLKNYYLKNKDKILENTKKRRQQNREKYNDYQKQYRLKNPEIFKKTYEKRKKKIKEKYTQNRDEILKSRKIYSSKNKEKILQYAKEYRLKNSENIKTKRNKNKNKVKEWALKNKEGIQKYFKEYKSRPDIKIKLRIYKNKYVLHRRKTDYVFLILDNVRARFRTFLKATNIRKTNRTFELVGCSAEELKIYLEKKFLPGMTWENYNRNTWHIDHIKPLSLAKNMDDIIRLKLMHYTNLQPLWAGDNIRKSNKYFE